MKEAVSSKNPQEEEYVYPNVHLIEEKLEEKIVQL